ncbi:DUF6300 family protein [Streptomyces sp. NPDC017991]|uniref:DUF6300 family protein n=1 Tax=Streptomyces sp. NPDC017991 TaxID=3365026 RepID=UPI0037A2AAAE
MRRGDDDEALKPAWWPCSRCRGGLTLHWRGPWVSGVIIELCPACDAHKPAARAFLDWHRDPRILPQFVRGLGDRDHARPRLVPRRRTRSATRATGTPTSRTARAGLTANPKKSGEPLRVLPRRTACASPGVRSAAQPGHGSGAVSLDR